MNSRNWKILIAALVLVFIIIGYSVQGQSSSKAPSTQKTEWSENIVGLMQRSDEFFELTFQANDLMLAGQAEQAQTLYRKILNTYADLDKTGYVKLALEECSQMTDKKSAAVATTSRPAATTKPAPAQVLDIKTIHVGYVHPLGKTRIIRTTVKMLGTTEMENNSPECDWTKAIDEIHYTCLKVNPDGSGVYEVSMPFEEQITGSSKGVVTLRYEKGKPAFADSSKINKHPLDNSRFYIATQNVRAQVTFTMIVAPDGTPLKVEGYQKAFEKLLNEALKDVGPLTKIDEQQLAAIKKNTIDKSMLETMKVYRPNLPEGKTLHVGETWAYDKSSGLDYRLESVVMFNGRPCAKIQKRTAASTPQKSNPNPNVQNETRIIEANGYLYLDYEKGEILLEEQASSFDFKQTLTKPHPFHLRQTTIRFSKRELIER
jgi:hypothetical protein